MSDKKFSLASKGFVICPTCKSVFFDKAWHHSLDEAKHLSEDKDITFQDCPACRMLHDKTFEGELRIVLSDEHINVKEEVFNAINNSDEQARERDPLDRVLWTEDKGNTIHVYTAENQLVAKIGKKLESAFKGSTLEVTRAEKERITRAYWSY